MLRLSENKNLQHIASSIMSMRSRRWKLLKVGEPISGIKERTCSTWSSQSSFGSEAYLSLEKMLLPSSVAMSSKFHSYIDFMN